MPGLSGASHQLGDKDGLFASGADLGPAPLGERLGLGRPVGRLSGCRRRHRRRRLASVGCRRRGLWCDVGLGLVVLNLVGLQTYMMMGALYFAVGGTSS